MKKMFPLLIFPALLILSCWGDSSPTSDKTGTFKVGGSVTDKNDAGIQDALVMIEGTNYSAADMTGSEGAYVFNAVKTGDYKIQALKDNCFFRPANMDVKIESTDIDTLKFTSVDSYIHGKVLDIMTDKGVAGMRIDIKTEKRFSGGYDDVDSAYTNNNGEYEFFNLDKKDYTIFFRLDYMAVFASTDYLLESEMFNHPEIIIPDYYFSSEKLQITKGEFSAETKTLYLEWTPSKSPYISGYNINYRRYPSGYSGPDHNGGRGQGSQTNNVSIIIKPVDMVKFYDENIISGELFFTVSPSYKKGNDYSLGFSGPFSESYGVFLSW